MSRYDLRHNFDDVFLRSVMVGLMATLHEAVRWDMQIGPDLGDVRPVTVPFYFSVPGAERYLQDRFANDILRDPEGAKAEGPYNAIPRGHVDLAGVSVLPDEIVNKYVRVDRNKTMEDGTLRTFSVETFFIPLQLDLTATVWVDTFLDELRCTQAVLGTFYKNRVFQVDTVAMRIPSVVAFPDKVDGEHNVDFKFEDEKRFTVKFDLTVKTSMPVFADSTEMFKGNTIQGFTAGQHMLPQGSIQEVPPASLLVGNQGVGPTGSAGVPPESEYTGRTAQGPTWPLSPNTSFPPGGGTGY